MKNFQICNLGLEKAEEPDIKLPTFFGRRENKGISEKNIYLCFIDCAKALTMWITTICGKFWRRWDYQTTLPVSWETCVRDKKQQLELPMEKLSGSTLGKE